MRRSSRSKPDNENENADSNHPAKRARCEKKSVDKPLPAAWLPAVGEPLLARFEASKRGGAVGTKWYPGTATRVHPDNTVDVEYDDGDIEERVLPKFFKPRGAEAGPLEAVRIRLRGAATSTDSAAQDEETAAKEAAAKEAAAVDEEPTVFVQCDKCDKWRRLRTAVLPSSLPGKWECALSDDPMRNRCSCGGGEDAPLSQMTAEQQARLASDGFVLLPEPAVWEGLELLTATDGSGLGKGRDAQGGRAGDLAPSSWSRPPKRRVNEALLLHGTQPGALLSMLANGLNERFSGTNAGTAFGNGVYLAEDLGKSDQYVELDERLSVRTQQSGERAVSMDTRKPIFPNGNTRELSVVDGVSPPLGGALLRYREFVTFHGEYVYPEFLIAYQRCSGGAPLQRQPLAPPPAPRVVAATVTATAAAPSYQLPASTPAPPRPKPKPKRAKKAKPPKDYSAPTRATAAALMRHGGGTWLADAHKHKAAAQSCGARWDSLNGMLYAPASANLSSFRQWLPKGAIPQLSAPCSLERLRRKGGGTLLDVPFDEKDDAKAAGARWDGDEKKWYVVEHASSFAAFERWLPLVE
ncbi:hypothetical protein EMIHUDRAFT_229417 [Emiliania huxleyi CCMP1516]|uniref:CW-type domain-containing protein n=2 Tax=Emiliania huxleyi TaxID=2903 RepID=A0A0D3KD47_EMIH1|nr:hypothetical protein EMIHUDRAFT_229417 [Emiliania huxleyi CCMP1516]EOD33682.1 hypothetical protein EMIHUDRAFT_229417 [Emiliania huxleyi CCMP1516]|eukprot:XP_005786111.1 hypothetical protein EMIHUDRAFT_229417 [Emiliania huxleyi CCMP1516]